MFQSFKQMKSWTFAIKAWVLKASHRWTYLNKWELLNPIKFQKLYLEISSSLAHWAEMILLSSVSGCTNPRYAAPQISWVQMPRQISKSRNWGDNYSLVWSSVSDPDPLFPNVNPRIRIRIRIHVKMRWIRNACVKNKNSFGRDTYAV